MTLIDNEIANLVIAHNLISPFQVDNLSNCRYNLRAGKAFLPTSGDELEIGAVTGPARWRRAFSPVTRKRTSWSIKPSESLVIMTTETIRIPDHLFATYSQLNGLARKGLMLMNVSIVEPGYHGPLSCFMVNFSRKTIHLHPDDEVAKICFHELTGRPANLRGLTIPVDEYERHLIDSAQLYPVSFMDIGGGVEKRIVERATKSVNRSIVFGGGAGGRARPLGDA